MTASFRVGNLVACLIGAAWTAAIVGGAEPRKDSKPDDRLIKLYEERVKLADQAYQACKVGYESGTITLDSLLAAFNELADAQLTLCKSKAERIVVRDKQVERAKDAEAHIRALFDVAARGGEPDKLARAGVERVKAEIALELEKRDAAGAVK